jgi:dolichol-phosphate mannosyltransferase
MNEIDENTKLGVPTYVVDELAPKSNRYAAAVFMINEGEKLHKQLLRMQEAKVCDTADIILADGGSSDGSTDPNLMFKYNLRAILTKRGSGKLGAQMRMAFDYILNQGYEGIIVIDGNNKDSVENIVDFVSELNAGFDHVQGSRFIPGGKHVNTPKSRLLGVKLLHAPLLTLASGFKYTDTTNGFRAYSKRLLTDERVGIFRDELSHYELHYYLAYRAPKLGFQCKEIPVVRSYPSSGKVPTKISPIRGNLDVLKRLFCTCLGFYNPSIDVSKKTKKNNPE